LNVRSEESAMPSKFWKNLQGNAVRLVGLRQDRGRRGERTTCASINYPGKGKKNRMVPAIAWVKTRGGRETSSCRIKGGVTRKKKKGGRETSQLLCPIGREQ